MSDIMQKEKNKKIVILYSGGLDSFILKKYAEIKEPQAEIKLIYFKHGCDSEQSELNNLTPDVEVRTIDWLNKGIRPVAKKSDTIAGPIYIPGRNLIFSALAACQELPDEIWLGTLIDEYNEQATDKNQTFIDKTQEVLNYVLSPFINEVKIKFPFVDEKFTKLQSIQWVLDHGVTKDELRQSISCWNHKGTNCGKCKQCFKRELIFRLLDIKDDYLQDPIDSESGKKFINFYKDVYNEGKANEDELNVYNMIKKLEL